MPIYSSLQPCYSCEPGSPDVGCQECGGAGYLAQNARGTRGGQLERLALFCQALAEDQLALIQSMRSVEEGLQDRFQAAQQQAMEAHRRNTGERERSLWEQNNLLRQEVRTLADTLGMRPVKIQGDHYAPKPQLLNDATTSDAARAVRLMVMDQIEEVFEQNAEFGPDQIRAYIRKSLQGSMEATVRQAAGIEDKYGSRGLSKDSMFGKRVREAVEPHMDAVIKELMPDVIEQLELPKEPEEWILKELRDLFVNRFRQVLRDEVRARAEKMARESLTEEVDKVLMEEFPGLRRRIAMARLGKPGKEG